MDVPIPLHMHIRTLRRISGRGGERKGGDGGRKSGVRGRAVRDESIVLGNGNVIGGIGKEKESGTGTRNETQGERASIVETGIDTTVARGSIDEETTNGAVRLLPQTDPLLSRMDVHRHFCHLKRLTLTGKKASK